VHLKSKVLVISGKVIAFFPGTISYAAAAQLEKLARLGNESPSLFENRYSPERLKSPIPFAKMEQQQGV
jgi:hypothetical protein